MKLKPATLLLFLVGITGLLLLLVVKCLHLQRSDYTSDIFTHYQLSRDWFYGKPLFYENSFGYHNRFHNYFINPLLAPFTIIAGVYGLFIALVSLLILALFRGLKMMQNKGLSIQSQLLFTLFFCSPLSYFVLHDEHYGFHVEILYFPLSVLFLAALVEQSRWYWLWALLIVLVKEDGAALLWSCGMGFLLLRWKENQFNVQTLAKKSLVLTFICVSLFVAGFAWLKFLNEGGNTRMGGVFESIQQLKIDQLYSSFSYLIGQRVQLTIMVLLLIYLYTNLKFTLGLIVFSIPITILNYLSGALYFEAGEFMVKNYFSLLWSPRISMYWGFWMGMLLLAVTQKPPLFIYPSTARTLACLIYGMGVFYLQAKFFVRCDVTRFDVQESITEAFKPNIEFIWNPEFADAAAIARELPDNYPVAPMYRVFGAFHRQDIIWLNALEFAYFPPRMILASYNKDEIPDVSKVMQNPYFMLYHEKLHIYCEAADTVYVNKAGLKGQWAEVSGQ